MVVICQYRGRGLCSRDSSTTKCADQPSVNQCRRLLNTSNHRHPARQRRAYLYLPSMIRTRTRPKLPKNMPNRIQGLYAMISTYASSYCGGTQDRKPLIMPPMPLRQKTVQIPHHAHRQSADNGRQRNVNK